MKQKKSNFRLNIKYAQNTKNKMKFIFLFCLFCPTRHILVITFFLGSTKLCNSKLKTIHPFIQKLNLKNICFTGCLKQLICKFKQKIETNLFLLLDFILKSNKTHKYNFTTCLLFTYDTRFLKNAYNIINVYFHSQMSGVLFTFC